MEKFRIKELEGAAADAAELNVSAILSLLGIKWDLINNKEIYLAAELFHLWFNDCGEIVN